VITSVCIQLWTFLTEIRIYVHVKIDMCINIKICIIFLLGEGVDDHGGP
jgi:hypothetical protein